MSNYQEVKIRTRVKHFPCLILTGQGKIVLTFNLHFMGFEKVKQSCIVKDEIVTNQIRAKKTIVILSNNTVAQFDLKSCLQIHFKKLYFVLFFFFSIQREKNGKIMSYYLISLEPIHIKPRRSFRSYNRMILSVTQRK